MPLFGVLFTSDDAAKMQTAILAAITAAVTNIDGKIASMSGTLQTAIDALTAQVTTLTSVDASAVALLTGLKTQLDAALAAAANSGATAAQLQMLSDLSTAIGTQTTALAAAVSANTPAPGP